MRRIPAATTILFALATGCSRTATSSAPAPSTATAALRSVDSIAPRTSTALPAVVPAVSTLPGRAGTSSVATLASGSAEQLAKEFVGALIVGRIDLEVPDADLWQQTLSEGHIIQTATLHDAADRASVAVSVAFDTPPGGETSDPVGVRVELRLVPTGWVVDGIGYL